MAEVDSRILPVVPRPQEYSWLEGQFNLEAESIAVHTRCEDKEQVGFAIEGLNETMVEVCGDPFSGDAKAQQAIWIGIPQEDEEFLKLCSDSGLWPEDRLGEEGYVLEVQPERIVIAANTQTGLFYGVQTLRQLVRGCRLDDALPCVQIADWPELKRRCICEDISRGPVPTPDFMRLQVRRLAEMKINMLMYYTEHVIKTKKHPAFAPPDGAISIEEWRELSEYARQHHITLVGNFQSLGHFEKILSYPQYSHLGERGRMLSPVLPESIELLKDIYSEVVPVFDGEFFAVHCDEAFDLGKGASRTRVEELGKGRVFADHILTLREEIQKYGKRVLVWGDMILQNPEVLDMLPKDIIIGTWDYDPRDTFNDFIEPFTQAGFDVIVTPGVLNSTRIMPNFEQTLKNIRQFASDGAAHDVYGIVTTVWDDGGSAFFNRDWYGVAYGAEQSWRPLNQEDSTFDDRFNSGLYGDDSNALTQAIWNLNSMAALSPTDSMNEDVLWAQLIPERGQTLRHSLEDWDKVAEACDAAEQVLEKAAPSRFEDEFDYYSFTIDLYRFLAESRLGVVEAAKSYRKASLKQLDSRVEARSLLIGALEDLALMGETLTGLASQFQDLWLRENRTYSLDIVLERYQARVEAIKDAEHRLAVALRDFDLGHCLPPPAQIRLAVEEIEGRYFREWLVCGPIASESVDGEETVDYLESMGGELTALPKVTQEFDRNGKTYRWFRLASPLLAEVDLASLFPENNRNVTLYAYANIDCEESQKVRATFGSSDGVEVFLNGHLIHRNLDERSLQIDDEETFLDLDKGRNHLMIKVMQTHEFGKWGFSFRLPDNSVRSRKNRYRIL